MNPHPLRYFLLRWLVNTVGVLTATQIVPGIHISSVPGLFVASLILGLLNTFVRPILTLLSLPLVLVSLGLFLWVINAGLLSLVAWLVRSLTVESFWSALGGAAVISIVSWLVGALLGVDRGGPGPPPPSRRPPRVQPETKDRPPEGRGPVIDV